MKDLKRMTLLLDFYGPLLTPRQQELMQAYYLEDLSLAEIAGEDGVSRQAVHDLIKRAETLLQEYEAKLGAVREYAERRDKLIRLEEALRRDDRESVSALLEELKAE
ncbi:MAG TPA: YlxM family DNA-binding protein [Symbiobacteriaceae bacterium]